MAMKVASTGAAVGSRGLRGLFSTFSSSSTFPFATPPSKADKPPAAEPSTNLFVSGTALRWVRIFVHLEIVLYNLVVRGRGLSKRTTSEGLRDAFAKFGQVIHAKVVTDRGTNYSKGFGFVRYTTIEEAAAGIKGMDGSYLDGWVIFAEYARPREPPPPLQNYGSQYGHRRDTDRLEAIIQLES
ncbi:hypothetical protein RJ640_004593 [Escallonia rubra]|uniref:RRM domain-containing protein n=1 Tax=Escallonia rubra TaxID=112253 RepID=A0AA88R8X7_9ASTE|nr:hypothetical protein RJ640_004593 [Escallonia rubra]